MRTREHIAGLSQYVTVDDCDYITSALQHYAGYCLHQFRWHMGHARIYWEKWETSGGWFGQVVSRVLYEEARKWRQEWTGAASNAEKFAALHQEVQL